MKKTTIKEKTIKYFKGVCSVGLALTVIAFAVGSNAADPPTQQQCQDAWDGNSASSTCGSLNPQIWSIGDAIVTVKNDKCRVQTKCQAAYARIAPRNNDFSGTQCQVTRLYNDNGYLKYTPGSYPAFC